HRHEVHAGEGGDELRAEPLIEDGPPWALVDVPIRGDGDDEDVALSARGLEVADMARVKEVEDAVALDDQQSPAAELGDDRPELLEALAVGVESPPRDRPGATAFPTKRNLARARGAVGPV